MGVKSEERRELWWKMNESHGGRMGVKTEGRGGEEGGGDRGICEDCEQGEAGEDKWHKAFILLRPPWFHF